MKTQESDKDLQTGVFGWQELRRSVPGPEFSRVHVRNGWVESQIALETQFRTASSSLIDCYYYVTTSGMV